MYKLCYYRFDEVTTQQGKPTGWDTVRNAEIGVSLFAFNIALAQGLQTEALQRGLHQRALDRENLRGHAARQHGPATQAQAYHFLLSGQRHQPESQGRR